MSLAANRLHPLQIEDAREAAYRASEKQREVEDELRMRSRELAAAERAYRQKLSERILKLHAGDDGEKGLAITTCETVAKGEREVSELRYKRDVARGIFEAAQQQAFRRGADRKDVNQLLQWSQACDLRTDAPPREDNVETFGARRAA